MFKENVSQKAIKSFESRETVEQFLARGGEIEVIDDHTKYKSAKISIKHLLDLLKTTPESKEEVMKYLNI